MNIPKTIKVGGLRYKIKIKDTIDDEDAIALFDTKKQEIQLEKATKASMEVSFIHEIFHAINVYLKEETTEFLAQALYQIIIDNPSLFRGGEKTHVHNK